MLSPFFKRGATVLVPAATPASTGVAVGTTESVFRIMNNGSVTAFLAYAATAALAEAAAIVPTAGNPQAVLALPPGAIEVVSAPPGSFWSGITASGSANCYITPGIGV